MVKISIHSIAQELLPKYKNYDEAYRHALWIIEWLTGHNTAYIVTNPEITITKKQQDELNALLIKHINYHMPLQYIFGTVPFLDLKIMVRPPILIPRPETEYWCSLLINQLKDVDNKNINILDMCTGTGSIGLALAHALPYAQIYAIDISDDACTLAQENALKNKIPNIVIIKSDLFKNIDTDLKFDLIVSNPPYISYKEWQNLDPEVREWEDKNALVAENSGLSIIAQIIKESRGWLKDNSEFAKREIPQLVIEIGYTQGKQVADLFDHEGYKHVKIVKDLAQNDRIVIGSLL